MLPHSYLSTQAAGAAAGEAGGGLEGGTETTVLSMIRGASVALDHVYQTTSEQSTGTIVLAGPSMGAGTGTSQMEVRWTSLGQPDSPAGASGPGNGYWNGAPAAGAEREPVQQPEDQPVEQQLLITGARESSLLLLTLMMNNDPNQATTQQHEQYCLGQVAIPLAPVSEHIEYLEHLQRQQEQNQERGDPRDRGLDREQERESGRESVRHHRSVQQSSRSPLLAFEDEEIEYDPEKFAKTVKSHKRMRRLNSEERIKTIFPDMEALDIATIMDTINGLPSPPPSPSRLSSTTALCKDLELVEKWRQRIGKKEKINLNRKYLTISLVILRLTI